MVTINTSNTIAQLRHYLPEVAATNKLNRTIKMGERDAMTILDDASVENDQTFRLRELCCAEIV